VLFTRIRLYRNQWFDVKQLYPKLSSDFVKTMLLQKMNQALFILGCSAGSVHLEFSAMTFRILFTNALNSSAVKWHAPLKHSTGSVLSQELGSSTISTMPSGIGSCWHMGQFCLSVIASHCSKLL
jgi:hypothetical protein